MRLLALWLGKLVQAMTRLRGGGSAFPGLLVERIRPSLLAEQAARLPRGSILVTGTNGKTTTVKLLAHLLERNGERVLTNRSGSNMLRGLLSTVLAESTWTGRLPYDVAVFEVDEPNVPAIAEAIRPALAVVLNLHRDQLDRYGELERTATLVGDGLPSCGEALLNADDPIVAALAPKATSVRWFGVAEGLRGRMPDDAALLTGAASGRSSLTTRLDAELLEADELDGRQRLTITLDGSGPIEATIALSGVYNACNATAAVAAAIRRGVPRELAARSLESARPAFGRGEDLDYRGHRLRLVLVKNPSSFTQVIRTQLSVGDRRHLLLALNDNFADGRDVSWIWDVDVEAMAGREDHILVSGLRANDLALRFKYAGLDTSVEPDLDTALDRFVASLPPGETGWIMPTYTAMLDLRRRLGRETGQRSVWE
jgi:UDP-N-acetylmuramyl tripeptide synthase